MQCYLELVNLALQLANVVVLLLEAPLELHRLRLEGVDARLALLQLGLELRHERAQVVVVFGHPHLHTSINPLTGLSQLNLVWLDRVRSTSGRGPRRLGHAHFIFFFNTGVLRVD